MLSHEKRTGVARAAVNDLTSREHACYTDASLIWAVLDRDDSEMKICGQQTAASCADAASTKVAPRK